MMTAKTHSESGRGEIRIETDDTGKVLVTMQEAQQDGISQPMEFAVACRTFRSSACVSSA